VKKTSIYLPGAADYFSGFLFCPGQAAWLRIYKDSHNPLFLGNRGLFLSMSALIKAERQRGGFLKFAVQQATRLQ
jgi:hypothetical protein